MHRARIEKLKPDGFVDVTCPRDTCWSTIPNVKAPTRVGTKVKMFCATCETWHALEMRISRVNGLATVGLWYG